jgi:hypothetical protein
MPGEIRDIRMIQKAFEQRWAIRPDYKAALLKRMMLIVADPNSTPREATAAAKALIAAEKQNQDDEHKFLDLTVQTRSIELDELAIELGIEVSAIEDAERESSSGAASIESKKQQ